MEPVRYTSGYAVNFYISHLFFLIDSMRDLIHIIFLQFLQFFFLFLYLSFQ